MNGQGVRVEKANGVARVVLARPPLNLLERGLIAALREAFTQLTADPSVRVAVLSGEGRAFSAGMDVKIFRDLDPKGARESIASLRDAIDVVLRAPFPTLALIRGACLGGAFELALACDLRLAASDAVMGLPEVRVGLPSVIHAALLPSIAGPTLASELLLTGATLSGSEAAERGLVNRAVPQPELEATVDNFLTSLLLAAPGAVRLQKELIVDWREARLRAAIDDSVPVFARAFATDEPREGARAFLEKRPPAWARRTRA